MLSLGNSLTGILIYLGIFVGVLMAFEGIVQLMSRGGRAEDARNRRLRLIAKGATTEEVLSLLKPHRAQWRLHALPLIGPLPHDLNRAGLTISPGRFLLICLTVSALAGLVLTSRLPLAAAVGLGLCLGLVLPVLLVRRRRDQRQKLLISQLPDALDLMSRGLKVGHPLNATIATVAKDMVDPVASEFGIILDQISFGDDLVSAFRDFADRVDVEDARYLATSVAIQNGTGGDLARILATLGRVIRGRITMRRKIKAISSEGRLTAVFMSLLPLFIFGMTSITSPSYYWGVSDDPLFRPTAIIVVGLIVANYLAMRRLVNFRI